MREGGKFLRRTAEAAAIVGALGLHATPINAATRLPEHAVTQQYSQQSEATLAKLASLAKGLGEISVVTAPPVMVVVWRERRKTKQNS